MRTDLDLTSHGSPIAAWHFRAGSDAWTTAAGRPCVVMAHGFAGTRDAALEPFAERFAAAGADAVVFDYRGFGDSGDLPGGVRQDVDHRRQREDYAAVVEQVRGLDGIDPDRVVLWGSSYSGGHVVAVAARDPRIAAVVSQGAAMDGRAAVLEIARYAGPLHLLKVSAHGLLGLVRPPHSVPAVGEPGTVAAITSHDGLSGYRSIAGASFRNEVLARGIMRIPLNRPVALASKVTCPMHLTIAEQDSVAPISGVEAVARKAGGPVQVERLDVGHFDIYLGEPFEQVVASQVAFLDSVLAPSRATR